MSEETPATPTAAKVEPSKRAVEVAERETYFRLSLAGNIVLSHSGRRVPDKPTGGALDMLHLRKIDLADEVLVLNVGGYIGESTRNEIAYAEAHGKPVSYLEPAAATDPPATPAVEGEAETLPLPEIIEDWLPENGLAGTRAKLVVRCGDSFLRHSRGPQQGHFWDMYGDDYQTIGLAYIALSSAPFPPAWNARPWMWDFEKGKHMPEIVLAAALASRDREVAGLREKLARAERAERERDALKVENAELKAKFKCDCGGDISYPRECNVCGNDE